MAEGIHVFVSYARADAVLVRLLARRLRDEGLGVFLDEWELAPGDVVSAELERAIRSSEVGIVVFSRTSTHRPWVLEEYYALLLRAVVGGGRLIPVLLDDVELPPFAGNRQAVDLSSGEDSDLDHAVAQLVRGVRKQPVRRT
jgi:hypothetical protein